MRRSHTIALLIDVPCDTVYRFLAEPRNYAEWAAVDPLTFKPLGNGDWQAEVRYGGIRHIRFTPPNAFGILDHAVFLPGETPLVMPMRVTPHDGGTELTFTFLQRPGMSDENFGSTVEWITTDFLTLKTLLEARFGN
jgi:uncharacterized protein YndB with AHSA1/START domain